MIVIVQSLDVSVAGEKKKGCFEHTRERYEFFSEFDKVVLLTQDAESFSDSFTNISHVPCAFSRSKYIRQILSRFSYFRWFYFYINSFFWLVKNRSKIDLVISDNIDSPVPLIVSILFKIPYVIYYRYDFASQIKNVNGRIVLGSCLYALERFAFKRVDALWVTSPHLAKLAESCGRKKRIEVIPNWFEIGKIENTVRSHPLKNSTGSHILFVGRLHKVKRVDLLLRAFSILHKNDPNLQLYLAGGDDGEEQNLVALANSLGISENVHFLGFINREAIFEIFGQSDLLVLPSKIEGNPRVLIEAMILQVPIVATNVNGIRDVVQHMQTGYLVDSSNPSELAHAIEYVLKNPEASTDMVKRAYDFAKQNFSKEGAKLKIYKEISALVPKYSNHNSTR